MNEINYNFISKIATLNSENLINSKKNASRNNSTVNKNESLANLNAVKNTNNNNSENPIKKLGRKNHSFSITKKFSEENSKLKQKESISNMQILNNKNSSEIFFAEEYKEKEFFINKSKRIFFIKKLEKEKIKDPKLKKIKEKEADSEKEESENTEESYISYNTEFLEKANYNNSTTKALVSVRKLTLMKNSVDMTGNININPGNNLIKDAYNEKNENLAFNENDLNAENHQENQEQNIILRKLSYKNRKDKKKLSANDKNNVKANKDYQEEVLNLKSNQPRGNMEVDNFDSNGNFNQKYSDCYAVRKQSSLGGEYVRNNSFKITKEIRRKDTNMTYNPEKKLSIDEGNFKNEKSLLQPLRVNKVNFIF